MNSRRHSFIPVALVAAAACATGELGEDSYGAFDPATVPWEGDADLNLGGDDGPTGDIVGSNTSGDDATLPGDTGPEPGDVTLSGDAGPEPGDVTLLGDEAPVIEPDPDDAAVVATDWPAAMRCGRWYDAALTFQNTGTTTWSDQAGYRLKRVGGSEPFSTVTSHALDDRAFVEPGQTYTFHFQAIPPETTSAVVSKWRLSSPDGVFGERAIITVDVDCPPLDDPPPIDVAQVAWLHADVSRWPTTSHVSDVRIRDDELCIFHTMAGRWPAYGDDGSAVEGNPWVFVYIDERWYAATYEWLRPGQQCKAMGTNPPASTIATVIGPHTKRSPVERWVPRSGEVVGFMTSTLARLSERTSNERSDVLVTRWP